MKSEKVVVIAFHVVTYELSLIFEGGIMDTIRHVTFTLKFIVLLIYG